MKAFFSQTTLPTTIMEVENEPIVKETSLWLETISNFHEELQRLRSSRSSTDIRNPTDIDLFFRPRPDSFPMTYPNDLEDGECSPSRWAMKGKLAGILNSTRWMEFIQHTHMYM